MNDIPLLWVVCSGTLIEMKNVCNVRPDVSNMKLFIHRCLSRYNVPQCNEHNEESRMRDELRERREGGISTMGGGVDVTVVRSRISIGVKGDNTAEFPKIGGGLSTWPLSLAPRASE